MAALAVDAASNRNGASDGRPDNWDLKIDRTPPDVILAGPVIDNGLGPTSTAILGRR
jgi:hypothetical protein